MSSSNTGADIIDTEKTITKVFSINLAQNGGTYDLCTASGGDVLIRSVDFYVSVGGAGFTSFTVSTNDAVPIAMLGSTLLAATLIGTNLTGFSTRTSLLSTKKMQYTIIGTGSAGIVKAIVSHTPIVTGAIIS